MHEREVFYYRPQVAEGDDDLPQNFYYHCRFHRCHLLWSRGRVHAITPNQGEMASINFASTIGTPHFDFVTMTLNFCGRGFNNRKF